MSLAAAKADLRRLGAERRAEAAAGEGAATRVAEHFLAAVAVAAGAPVSGYWPIRDELDPRPLMQRLHEAGHACGLPVVEGAGEVLAFRAWRPGAVLQAAGFGLSEPPASAPAMVPEVLLVPLLAFDLEGHRLGYGGGFYDRTLARLRRAGRVLAVGLAYDGQRVEAVPHGPGDERLDWVITEEMARRTG